MSETLPAPNVFISYSWTSPGHVDLITQFAERLKGDGVQVVFDQWQLKHGHDKYVFMEKMVHDTTVTHVLIFSDMAYSKKADDREAGVGTESQIISKEVYEDIGQTKFIPIICERDKYGEPCLPLYLGARKYIDFSTPERVNKNWEELIRLLFDRPARPEPAMGTPPSYLHDEAMGPPLPTRGKYLALKTALEEKKITVPNCRNDFLNGMVVYLDTYRVRSYIPRENIFERVEADLRSLIPLRDQIIEWVVLESIHSNTVDIAPAVIDMLERLLSLKYPPGEVTRSYEGMFDTHAIIAYEIFLYTVAILIRENRLESLHCLFTSNFLVTAPRLEGRSAYLRFDGFYTRSSAIEDHAPKPITGIMYQSALAELIRKRATHAEVPFLDLMQAEAVVFLQSMIMSAKVTRWYPRSLIFTGFSGTQFPLFQRGITHRGFEKIKIITGITSADDLRNSYKAGIAKAEPGEWALGFAMGGVNFEALMHLRELDSLD